MKKKNIAVIGGGAAGMTAAIAAGRYAARTEHKNTAVRILLLEARDRIGKKILSTGNGRCNLSNLSISPKNYHGTNPAFTETVLRRFGAKEAIAFFQSLGLECRTEEGRIYPRGNQATAVLDALRNELGRLDNVDIVTDFHAERIVRSGGGFVTEGSGTVVRADAVILAAGGCASPAVGSQKGGFFLLEPLGHTLVPIYPALTPLKTNDPFVHALQGVRFFGEIRIFREGMRGCSAYDSGELLFSSTGVSGIPAMNVSGRLLGGPGIAEIDFLTEYTPEDVRHMLAARQKMLAHLSLEDFLTGILHKKIGGALLKKSRVEKLNRPTAALTPGELTSLVRLLKGLRISILENRRFEHAQVSGGGALTAEFSPDSMESAKVRGLYAAGEVFDLYGDCGGYNLHWAWASGLVAGQSAAEKALVLA